jgi:hypothetical protein
MSDPNSTVSVQIVVNGEPDGTATARPIPEFGSPEWDAFIRDIEGKIKTATGQ